MVWPLKQLHILEVLGRHSGNLVPSCRGRSRQSVHLVSLLHPDIIKAISGVRPRCLVSSVNATVQ